MEDKPAEVTQKWTCSDCDYNHDNGPRPKKCGDCGNDRPSAAAQNPPAMSPATFARALPASPAPRYGTRATQVHYSRSRLNIPLTIYTADCYTCTQVVLHTSTAGGRITTVPHGKALTCTAYTTRYGADASLDMLLQGMNNTEEHSQYMYNTIVKHTWPSR